MKPLIYSFFTLVFIGTMSSFTSEKQALTQIEQQVDTTVYYINQVEEKPEFVGGKQALIKFLVNNVKYPKAAEIGQKQGTVLVEMTMEKDGTFSKIETINSPFGFGLEEEAMRVMKLSEGQWSLAKIKGEPVRIKWVYPIKFSLY